MSKEYFDGLKKRQDYNRENQIYLKRRVFLTFQNLIQTFFNKDIKELKNMLDLGASDRALVQIGRKFGLDAVGLDINDINFEKDNFGF